MRGGGPLAAIEALPPAAAGLVLAAALLAAPLGTGPGESWSFALYDRSGELLGATVAADGMWRFPPGPPPPDKYVAALTAYEDRRFFGHPGFDPAAILRAALQNARAGRILSGGSTLSMQLARLVSPPRRRDIAAKLSELRVALALELRLGKRGILEAYAARAPFGGNLVGLEAASFRVFGHPPGRLTWAEAAALAVLPNSPSLSNLSRNRAATIAKRDRLLAALRELGTISAEEEALAEAEPLPPEPFPIPRAAPHLLEEARRRFAGGGPLRVATTLDGPLQERARTLVERRVGRLSANGVWNAACVVASVPTGEILAYVGNVWTGDGADHGQDNDMASAPRSSGSVLKPFLYAAMLDSGEIAPSALVPDLPTRIGSFNPENNSGSFSGAVGADEALARSLNVPFVRLLRAFGVERFKSLLGRIGLGTVTRSAAEYGLTLILGGAEARLDELAGAYALLARTARGESDVAHPGSPKLDYIAARTRETREGMPGGDSLTRQGATADAPFSRAAAYLTLRALLEVGRPEEEASWQDFASSRKIAWKTGTSFGFRDAWAVGVTPEYVVAVWTGNANGEGRPDLRGYSAAAPILFDVFQALPRGPWFELPSEELDLIRVCAESGWPASRDCAATETVLAPRGAPLPRTCPYCTLVHLSPDGRKQVSAEGGGAMITERRFVLPPAIEYWYKKGHLSYRPLPPRAGPSPEAFAILFPEPGSRIFVPVELGGEPGRVVFEAMHRQRGERLHWHLDGSYIDTTEEEHRIELRPSFGRHELVVMDESGGYVARTFEVLSDR
jgi:penicillin-binding protein 1C